MACSHETIEDRSRGCTDPNLNPNLWSETMIAESESASLVKQLAIPVPGAEKMPQGYFRSKLFIAPYSTNPLIAAAGPLFSLLERLCISTALPAINSLHQNIDHELKAFHSKLTASDYEDELVAIARYLISAVIDEILGKNYLRLYGKSPDFQAFTPLTKDGTAPQTRFFEILAYIKERPAQYLDLIELAYYCLIAGFEGEQHLRADGRQTLDNLIDELYFLIQEHRVNKPCKLYHEKILPKEVKTNHKPLAIAVLTAGLLLSTLLLSHFILENKAKTLLAGHFQHSIVDQ